MSRVLLFAATTGYQTRSFLDAARRIGVDVLLATDRCHVLDDPWGDRALPIRFDQPFKSAASLLAVQADGIVAVADRPTLIASLVAEKLGIPWHPAAAVAACRNKHAMRELFARAGLSVPGDFLVAPDADPRPGRFPCVLKPLGLSASRGVIRANDEREFVTALRRIRAILRDAHEGGRSVQVEDYIEGREFALEGFMTRGELQTLAIFDKPDPLEGPFFEETIYVTPSRELLSVQQAIVETAKRAVAALGLWHGPIHAEMRVNARGVWMLEVAARPIGGLCGRALRFEGGITLEELVILHAMRRMPADVRMSPPALGVMMIPIPRGGVYRGVAGVENARGERGIDDVIVTAKPGQELVPLPEGGTYLGFIFAGGEKAAEVEDALRRAHRRLDFEIQTSLPVVLR